MPPFNSQGRHALHAPPTHPSPSYPTLDLTNTSSVSNIRARGRSTRNILPLEVDQENNVSWHAISNLVQWAMGSNQYKLPTETRGIPSKSASCYHPICTLLPVVNVLMLTQGRKSLNHMSIM